MTITFFKIYRKGTKFLAAYDIKLQNSTYGGKFGGISDLGKVEIVGEELLILHC